MLSGMPIENSRTRCGRLGWSSVFVDACSAAAAALASDDIRGGGWEVGLRGIVGVVTC